MMRIDKPKEYWLRLISKEGDEPISAGVPNDRDALWHCQMLAAIGIEETNDTGPLADIFAAIHRTAAGQLLASGEPVNECSAAIAAAEGGE